MGKLIEMIRKETIVT